MNESHIQHIPCDRCTDGYDKPLFFGLIKRVCKRCGGYTRLKLWMGLDMASSPDVAQFVMFGTAGKGTSRPMPPVHANSRCVIIDETDQPLGTSNPALIMAQMLGVDPDNEWIKEMAAYCDEPVTEKDIQNDGQ